MRLETLADIEALAAAAGAYINVRVERTSHADRALLGYEYTVSLHHAAPVAPGDCLATLVRLGFPCDREHELVPGGVGRFASSTVEDCGLRVHVAAFGDVRRPVCTCDAGLDK